MAILELKMEWLQLENETLSFRLDNLSHVEDVNVEENANERDDGMMVIDQGAPAS